MRWSDLEAMDRHPTKRFSQVQTESHSTPMQRHATPLFCVVSVVSCLCDFLFLCCCDVACRVDASSQVTPLPVHVHVCHTAPTATHSNNQM